MCFVVSCYSTNDIKLFNNNNIWWSSAAKDITHSIDIAIVWIVEDASVSNFLSLPDHFDDKYATVFHHIIIVWIWNSLANHNTGTGAPSYGRIGLINSLANSGWKVYCCYISTVAS